MITFTPLASSSLGNASVVVDGQCECGCGGATTLIKQPSKGIVGTHKRFCKGHRPRSTGVFHVPNKPTPCSKCGTVLPWNAAYFVARKRQPFGCEQPCKKCHVIQVGLWQKAHGEKHNANTRKWQRVHKEAQAARIKRYQQLNPIKARIRAHRRRQQIKTASLGLTQTDIERQLIGQHHRCWWCSKKLKGKYEVDHRIPLAKNGVHDRTNVVIACPKCNHTKNAKLPQDWAGRLF